MHPAAHKTLEIGICGLGWFCSGDSGPLALTAIARRPLFCIRIAAMALGARGQRKLDKTG